MGAGTSRAFFIDYIDQNINREQHRAGWQYVLDHVRKYQVEKYEKHKHIYLFDTYVDRTFLWANDDLVNRRIIPYKKKWFGVIHHTQNTEFSTSNVEAIFSNETFLLSLPLCKGFVVMSKYLQEYVKKKLDQLGYNDLPVIVIYHPTELFDKDSNKMFTMEKFLSNNTQCIVSIGAWLRNPFTIYRLITPAAITKAALQGISMAPYMIPNDFDAKTYMENNSNKLDTNFNTNRRNGINDLDGVVSSPLIDNINNINNINIINDVDNTSDDSDDVDSSDNIDIVENTNIVNITNITNITDIINVMSRDVVIMSREVQFQTQTQTQSETREIAINTDNKNSKSKRFLKYKKDNNNNPLVKPVNKWIFYMNKFVDSSNINASELNDMVNSVEKINYLSNDDYDRLLSENIVFIDLIDASACNTVIECIARNTPILVNKLPAIVEVLGPHYPFYYESIEEANYKLSDYNYINEAHHYLKSMDKSFLRIETFIEKLLKSPILHKTN
ncbi:MAG: putative WcaK-like polysaccharide pyruvyl transferase [Terrestrivirus sp.]|uniref:Putative WcaK-like polysaccharide pyruvyl transferase n=1 Tax=Terrestrivirus sp. TaxID=2487775 RepID=A0A3G4ZP06_9VIRU|nr:MAG: putative WcaK-like polysaccharide pyruvyl transferase [Terrestrivirus sp.]